MRYPLREFALTKTYARSSQHRSGVEGIRDDRFAVALLRPLSPEQLAWSIMQATSLTDATLDELKANYRTADAENVPEQADDPRWQEGSLHNALKDHVDTFVSFFGIKLRPIPPRCPNMNPFAETWVPRIKKRVR